MSSRNDDTSAPGEASLRDLVADLRRRVTALEESASKKSAAEEESATLEEYGTATEDEQPGEARSLDSPIMDLGEAFWALRGLIDRLGPSGGVLYTGHVTPPGAEAPLSWQMGLTTEALEDLNFAEAAAPMAALGHPIRLALLQAIYEGRSTAAELGEDDRFGTSGQIYHHIHALAGAGWLENSKRGHWRIPAQKIIPLLTLVLIGTH